MLAGLAEEQYTIAAHHYSNARWKLAVEEFTQFLQDYPDDERADGVVFYLGESLVQVGRFQDAHDRFVEYGQRSPGGKHLRQSQFRAGETLYLDGQTDAAREALKQFVEAHPDDALCEYAYPYLGEIALAAGQPRAAREAFEQGLKQFPNGPLAQQCRFGLARALETLGDSDAAIRFYEFLGGSDRRSEISDDALLQMAILYYQKQRFAKALDALQRHREEYPGSELAAHAAYWLGRCQASMGQLRAATETLSASAARFPNHELAPAMLFAAGQTYRQMKDFPAAKEAYQRLLDTYPHSDSADDSLQTLVKMAWEENDPGNVRALAEQFAREYAASPLLGLVQQTAARACLKQAHYDQAIELLQPMLAAAERQQEEEEEQDAARIPGESHAADSAEATQVTQAPGSLAVTRYYLALALLGVKRPAEALEQLDLLANGHEPRGLANGVHVARASALLELERYEPAVEALQRCLAADPNGPDAEKCRAQLAVTCARLERWQETQHVFEQMRRHHEDQQLYLSSLEYMAETAYDHGQRDLAKLIYGELARDANPQKFIALGISGLAWLDWTREGGAAGSARQFERLLKRFPDSPMAAEAAMMRGEALEKIDRPAGALAMYHLVMRRYADSTHVGAAMLAAARIHDALEQDREAEPLLRSWLKQNPTSDQRPGALYELAFVLVDLEREGEAVDVFQQIHDQCPASRYWSDATYRLAERAARAKDYQHADALAVEIVQRAKEPQMVAYSLYLRGQLAAAAKRWEDVVTLLETLLREHPQSPHQLPAEFWLAEAHYRQRHYEQAGKLFDKLAQQTRDQNDAWVAMVPLRRAQVRAHRHQWQDAYDIAVQIETRFPDFSQQHEVDYLVGRYFASQAEFKEAREAYLRVIRSATGRGTETAAVAQWMIGETYFMQKQYNQAIKAYYRVEGLYPFPRWKAAALLQAGKCHEMIGRWSEATELYTRVVKDYAQTRFVDKAAKRLSVAQQRADLMRTR